MINRRTWLLGAGALAGASVVGLSQRLTLAAEGDFEFTLTEAEWRERLSEMEFYVLREHGTERAFTSPLDKVYDPGMYHCAGCDQALYSSDTKYDSRTGWPSFWEAEPGAIGTSVDNTFGMVRTECHCSRCGGHQGHIFDDGPEPTGKRHCINGVALRFVAA
ncbi:peptide-methionine (R)-S-oxide reductase MsrB [Pelagibacterium montanilacus]|uniref:peptide-methionine (R)-S-oxide reductase MsrB n=1 Tax=Pelagibacterium montanilacus TaxID=2185280 RepID=UPI000F8DCB7C|nr:peptide-methionine (R)-S-oxide reductase MsrB [Pelagibacterium montanilacus]